MAFIGTTSMYSPARMLGMIFATEEIKLLPPSTLLIPSPAPSLISLTVLSVELITWEAALPNDVMIPLPTSSTPSSTFLKAVPILFTTLLVPSLGASRIPPIAYIILENAPLFDSSALFAGC